MPPRPKRGASYKSAAGESKQSLLRGIGTVFGAPVELGCR